MRKPKIENDIPPTDAEIKHNRSLWKHYPLGIMYAIFNLCESILPYLTPSERLAFNKTISAIDTLDRVIRKRYAEKLV